MRNIIQKGGRYNYGETDDFKSTLAEQEGLKPSYVQAFAGSSAPLHQAVLAFTSPTKPYIMADPGYEAGGNAARFIGAKVIKVPLTKDFKHDVKAMAAADPNAGPDLPVQSQQSHRHADAQGRHRVAGRTTSPRAAS